jgi:hypothetical protein
MAGWFRRNENLRPADFSYLFEMLLPLEVSMSTFSGL